MTDQRSPGTRAVHAGLPEGKPGEPFLPGPAFAAPYHLPGDPADSPYVYVRFGNPTWARYEAAVGELEGGEVVLFASGMAAVSAVLLALARPGQALVVPADAYYTTREVAEHLAAGGLEVRQVPTSDAAYREALPGAALVLMETPSNPGLEVVDIAALARAAHAQGALVAIDNTVATPLLQRPLELGADLSVVSGTKAMTGHADVMVGYVAAGDPQRAEQLRAWRRRAGGVPGVFEAWLAHRSLATLGVRVARQCANAVAVAQLLLERDDVTGVRYPGLPGDPAHAVASTQMHGGFGPVVGFDLGDAAQAERFLGAAELVIEATSFGSVHSSAERRARWGSDAVGEGFIRFSAGIEDTEDLLADVSAALDAS